MLALQGTQGTQVMQDGPPRCGAKCKDGHACMTTQVMPNGRCRMHFGKNPSGIANGNYRHGRYSKVMPTKLLERFAEYVSDPDYLSLRQDIALSTTRISLLLEQLETGEALEAWRVLEEQLDAWDRVASLGIKPSYSEMVHIIRKVVSTGLLGYAAFRDIRVEQTSKAKLVDTERKRLESLNRHLTLEQAEMMLLALTNAIMEYVPDKAARANIMGVIAKIQG